MVSFFGKKTANWVGVDIGSSFVKLVVLSKRSGLIGLDAYAVVSLPPTAVVDGSIQEVQSVADAIERGTKICGIKQGNAIAAVPSSAVIIKRMECWRDRSVRMKRSPRGVCVNPDRKWRRAPTS